MIMCVLLCYPVSIHMSQLQATGRPISSYLLKVLQIANFSQITHSPTFGRAFTW